MKQTQRILLIIAGSISLALGIIGILVPILPTTPFLLISAACYVRSSERLYVWLIHHKWFGSIIRNYREHKAIPLGTKIFAISMLWVTILYSSLMVVNQMWLKVVLILIALAVSAHILHFKTLKKTDFENRSDE